MGELRTVFSSAIVAILISSAHGLDAAHAQQPTPAQVSAIRGSCRSDFMANCSGVQPGGRDALLCLEHNVAKLSPSCKAAVSAVMPAPAAPAASIPPAPPPPAAAPSVPPATAAAPPAAVPPAVPAPTTPKAPPRRAATAAAPPHAAAPVHKPSPAQIASVRQSCRSDFMAHCQGITPGGRDALLCLQRNVQSLSPECNAAVAATMERPRAPAAEVAPPVPVAPAMAPLKVRRFILPQRRIIIVTICHTEVQTLCASVPPGGGRILECLGENAGQLSPACYDAIARVSVR